MLTATRKFAKSWVAAIIVGLLILSFAVFGFNGDVFQFNARDAVISAGSRTITGPQFRAMFEARRQQAEQRAGQPISTQLAVENGVDKMLLQQLADDAAMGELLRKIGLRPSGRLVTRILRERTELFDPITGEFDRDAYAQFLAQNGLNEEQFEREMADQIASEHVGAAMVAGLTLPRSYAAVSVLYGLEQRDAGFFPLTPDSVPRPPAPTDAQLTQLMNENRAALTRPEMRILTVVRFSPETLAKPPEVSEAEIQKRFEFRKDTIVQPETRSLVQIPAKDAAAAQQIAARLQKGEDPAAVAKAVGATAVVYTDKPKTAIADRRVADAAFGLAAGQVSGPIQGSLGLSVVKVTKATPGREPTLEDVREIITAEVRKDAAAQAVYDQSTVYEKANAGGASLAEAAKAAGAPVITVGPVSKEGRDAQNQPVQGLDPQLLDIAFGLPAGGESDLQETGTGEYYALRVERIVPSAMPPLAEVREQLAAAWTRRQIGQNLQAKADELVARVRKGESLEAVAASVGQRVSRAVALDRRTATQRLPEPLAARVFVAKAGEAFTAPVQDLVLAVGKVEAVRPPPVPQTAQFVQLVQRETGPMVFQDMVAAVRRAARDRTKLKIDFERARAVLGLEPLAETEKGKAGAGKAETGE